MAAASDALAVSVSEEIGGGASHPACECSTINRLPHLLAACLLILHPEPFLGALMRFSLAVLLLLSIIGCETKVSNNQPAIEGRASKLVQMKLADARKGFQTKIVQTGAPPAKPDVPDGKTFELITYKSPVGPLAAYITPSPGDGKKHPAIVWITGGDNNSIGDVWSPQPRNNDQSVSAFRKAGIVVMFPSQRGGNENPGKREGFLGEVDDVLAATDHLASLDYVDPNQIYLGGHSTGGTLAILVGQCSERYKAIYALGPVANPGQYGGEFIYCDPKDPKEMVLRSPIDWLHCVESPMYVIEGERGNWDGAVSLLAETNVNSNIQFLKVRGHDHFSVIGPITEKIADKIVKGEPAIGNRDLVGLR